VVAWVEQSDTVHLKAVDEHGDPVELAAEELKSLIAELSRLHDIVTTEVSMSGFEERLKRLNQEARDREQRERSAAAGSAAEARANEQGIALNRGLVTRITAELGKTAAKVRSSFAGGRVPMWNETPGDNPGGGYFIIPDASGPRGEVTVSLIPLTASVKCTVSATRRGAGSDAFSKSRDFNTPIVEAEVTAWVESMLHDAFAVFYGAQE